MVTSIKKIVFTIFIFLISYSLFASSDSLTINIDKDGNICFNSRMFDRNDYITKQALDSLFKNEKIKEKLVDKKTLAVNVFYTKNGFVGQYFSPKYYQSQKKYFNFIFPYKKIGLYNNLKYTGGFTLLGVKIKEGIKFEEIYSDDVLRNFIDYTKYSDPSLPNKNNIIIVVKDIFVRLVFTQKGSMWTLGFVEVYSIR